MRNLRDAAKSAFTLLGIIPAIAMGQSQTRVHSLTGTIREHPAFHSAVLGNERGIHVYLPPQYEQEPSRRFPVLYMHDGQNVFDGFTSYIPNQEWKADEAAESLIKAKLIEPIIIVAVDNGAMARADEFLPTAVKTSDGKGTWGGHADKYGDMLLTEIKPFIDRTYRTKPDGKNTGLCGSSFGGIVTLYLGIKHPEKFGKLGVVSPSLWWDDGVMSKMVDALPSKTSQKIWLDMGSAEGAPVESLAAHETIATARKLSTILEKKGWKLGHDLTYFEDSYAEHNEAAWARRFPAILMFLFPNR